MINAQLKPHTINFGCDPEFFFQKDGKIVGSEKVIDIKKGFKAGNGSKFIVDGVQAEINPTPNSCRKILAGEIASCMISLHRKMQSDPGLSVNFSPTVKITKEELDSLDEKSRVFGCAPSKNTNKASRNAVKIKDPKKYMYRSAGGHIHIGKVGEGSNVDAVLSEPARLITIMDIIVGNTCVLIDRDPSNKERRKTYGKAGEYRTPAHGVEYRTLSNFWLRSYPLMSFVMNLARFSVSIMAETMPGRDFERELLKLVDLKKIHQAINENDAKLAWANFQAIKPFIVKHTQAGYDFPLTVHNIECFEYFVAKGVDHWFKEDAMQHWMKITNYPNGGWEEFLLYTVKPQMLEERIAVKSTPLPAILRK